jgi:2-hydroxycyclohexanecarboxyl-CoA dehydrogenase
MINLEGKVAVVTGGGSGIGRSISLRLAEQGAKVAVTDLNAETAEKTASEITAAGGDAIGLQVDVASTDQVAALPAAVREHFGLATIVVNNAGWDLGMPFVDTTPEFWSKVIGINYVGPVAMSYAFVKDMIDEGAPGRIINIASDAGRVGSMGETVYAGAKGGVIAFSKSLAREMARHAINVNVVSPGPTDTPLFYEQPEKVRNAVVRAIPLRRLGKPEELAAAVAFFASDEASFITGQVLSVSGGLTMVD